MLKNPKFQKTVAKGLVVLAGSQLLGLAMKAEKKVGEILIERINQHFS